METLLTALFYLWLVITILLMAMWFLRRQDLIRGEEEEDELLYDDSESGSASAESDTPELDQSVHAEPVEDPAPEAVVDAQPEEVLPPADEEPAQAEEAVTEQTEPVKPAAASKSRRKKRKSAAEPAEPVDVGLLNGGLLAGGLLDGVALPYDLVTANERVTELDRHVILLSTNSDAEAVGTAFADELVKLGYEIEPDGDDQAKAVRGDQVLSLRISPNAGTRGSGKYRRYPTAGDTDVAIEVWTGSGSPPKLAKN